MNDTTIATIRTAFTAFWTSFALSIASWLGWELEVGSWQYILAVTVGGGIVWRISELLTKVPYLGYILFGVNKEPSYSPLPPPVGPPVPDDAGFIESSVIWTIVGVLVIVALILYITGNR